MNRQGDPGSLRCEQRGGCSSDNSRAILLYNALFVCFPFSPPEPHPWNISNVWCKWHRTKYYREARTSFPMWITGNRPDLKSLLHRTFQCSTYRWLCLNVSMDNQLMRRNADIGFPQIYVNRSVIDPEHIYEYVEKPLACTLPRLLTS